MTGYKINKIWTERNGHAHTKAKYSVRTACNSGMEAKCWSNTFVIVYQTDRCCCNTEDCHLDPSALEMSNFTRLQGLFWFLCGLFNDAVFDSHLCGLVARVSGYRFRGPGFDFFLIWYNGVESNWVNSALRPSIVPAPGDYDDGETGGMMIGKGNKSTLRKPASVPLCPPQTSHALLGREPGLQRWETSD
jgi:hypothetical protein